jgi:hypothetical protein
MFNFLFPCVCTWEVKYDIQGETEVIHDTQEEAKVRHDTQGKRKLDMTHRGNGS